MYGPDHIYSRIAAVHGIDPAIVHRAAVISLEDGISIQTYADPVCAATMLALCGYIARAVERYAEEERTAA